MSEPTPEDTSAGRRPFLRRGILDQPGPFPLSLLAFVRAVSPAPMARRKWADEALSKRVRWPTF
jgi:hypothetical protein